MKQLGTALTAIVHSMRDFQCEKNKYIFKALKRKNQVGLGTETPYRGRAVRRAFAVRRARALSLEPDVIC